MIIQSIIVIILVFSAMKIKEKIDFHRKKTYSNFYINSELMNDVILDASNIYNDILEKNIVINGDKIDLAIFISSVNLIDEDVLLNLIGFDKNKVLEIIDYNLDDVKQTNVKNESIEERVEFYKSVRFRKQLKWDIHDLIVEMMNISHVCQKLLFRLNEEKVDEIKEKHDTLVNFYYHNYPEDKSVKKMIKK